MTMVAKALVIASGVLVLGATTASAAVVCNKDGDCWRTKKRYGYKPEFGLTIHSDSWKWRDRDRAKYRWREGREGRGYWRNGVWITF